MVQIADMSPKLERFMRDYPWRLGFTMGEPNNAALQCSVIMQALALTDRDDIPVLEVFEY